MAVHRPAPAALRDVRPDAPAAFGQGRIGVAQDSADIVVPTVCHLFCDSRVEIGIARSSIRSRRTTMKFLCLAFGDEKKSAALTEGEMRALGEKCAAYDEELRKTGRLVGAGSLGWSAKTMRRKDGKLIVTDGPFSEAKEIVGGFVIIEARDQDEAVEIASLHPAARMGEELGWGIELRPMEQCQLQEIARRPR
jgi:hypothetical protein